MITHAGAITYRNENGSIMFLVVASSTGAHWVLPKGHIETGETAAEAALRELREEAGIVGEIVKPLSLQRFDQKGEQVVAQYFLVRAVGTCPAMEQRARRWQEADAALALLSFEDARRALEEGVAESLSCR